MLEEIQLLQNQRISMAFPPTSTNNSNYQADIHKQLENIDFSNISISDIIYRPIKYKRDIVQLRQLQNEWFPIAYSDSFYTQVLEGKTQSIVAEIELKYHTGRKEKYIIGAMVYQNRQTKGQYYGNQWREWFCSYFQQHYAIYIMTIGVINEFRGKGIAEYMINQLKQQIIQHKSILKYIYLDMVTYNLSASKFYLKNQFVQVRIKRNHYEIENKVYDALVYLWKPQ